MVPIWHQKSPLRFTPSARKQHVLQRKHGQLPRDFNLLNLCEIHAQRVGIPRGADVIQQVSLQPLCANTWYCTFLTCDCEFRFETHTCTYLPRPLHCKRPLFAVEGRRGRRSQSPWELPSAGLRSSCSKGTVPREPEMGSPCPEVRSGLTSIWCEVRTCRQGCPQDRRPGDRSVRLFFVLLPEQTCRGRVTDPPPRQESHVCRSHGASLGKPESAGNPTGQRVPEAGPEGSRWSKGQCVARLSSTPYEGHASSHAWTSESDHTSAKHRKHGMVGQ